MSVPLWSAIPVLRVGDYARARAFYEGQLGFEVTEEGGDPARFGIYRRDRATIFLDAWNGADPPSGHDGWRAYLHVDDADRLAEELRTSGVEIKRGPVDAVYGLREIDIEDPDGNRICFGQDLNDDQKKAEA